MPKNIVLLSDGTGNSSAQLLKTNVWRIYEALELTDPSKQVACYDDGVGTSSFRPLAIVGGAFGVGLRRNVLRLYRFLCEHYDPGDRIFLFGFSRGAFTVRVLNALVCSQGIVKTRPTLAVAGATHSAPNPGSQPAGPGGTQATAVLDPVAADDFVFGGELVRMSAWAYRTFRKEFNQTGGLVTIARFARDLLFWAFERVRGLKPYDQSKNYEVKEIAFLGVWDTVDAYGLPIDELTSGVDKWVWPLSMPELTLSDKVKRACHVLALDDERNTFHPVLWDESKERQNNTDVADERISQVWFAGMHSNVGGGYADDSLSYVSLEWMTTQASKKKLLFVPALLAHHTAKADVFGRVYDSRSGLKGYYRYNPRKIEWLTNGQRHEQVLFGRRWPKPSPKVTIARPKIHESVFERIAAAPEAYAPIVFPEHYGIVMKDGRIVDGESNPYEPPAAASRRVKAQEAAWDLVWWRRLVYFAAVGFTAFLLARPFSDGAEEALRTPDLGPASQIVGFVGEWVPSLASPWMDYFEARPGELFGGVALLLLLSSIGGRIQGALCGKMRGVWLKVIPPAIEEYKSLEEPASWILALRSHKLYQGAFAVLRRKLLPSVFGIATLVCLAGVVNRVPLAAANLLGWTCEGNGGTPLAQGGSSQALRFNSSDFCTATGVRLEERGRYRLTLTIPKTGWLDNDIPVDSPSGFTAGSDQLNSLQRVIFTVFAPFRRVWGANWFVPIARVGERGIEQRPLNASTSEFTAESSGELFLFVNDAILPIGPGAPGWSVYYGNNHGTATVVVTRLPDAPATP